MQNKNIKPFVQYSYVKRNKKHHQKIKYSYILCSTKNYSCIFVLDSDKKKICQFDAEHKTLALLHKMHISMCDTLFLGAEADY